MKVFIDRQREIADLNEAWDRGRAELRLLYGRRRVGKTYLLQHFLSQGKPHCYFLASAMTIGANLERLAQVMIDAHVGRSHLKPADLPTLPAILALYEDMLRTQRCALILDEFQYLVDAEPSIPSQIQAWWDMTGIHSQAFVVLCGSHIGMMETLTGGSQPLYGRFTSRIKLQPMNYYDTALFYQNSDWSTRDKLIAYGVVGGTPKYHAAFSPDISLGSNIVQRILSPDGLMHNEPENTICSSSVRDPALYNSILRSVARGDTRRTQIEQRAGITPSQFGYCVQTLMDLGWMDREKPFGEDSAKRSIYTITDHFIHFWYRFVSPSAGALEFQDAFDVYATRVEPYLNDYMGRYVFEDICMQYLKKHAAGRYGLRIERAGRYWNRDGSVEIDIVGDLEDSRILVCECKWSSSPIGVSTYYDLMRKASLLPPPRNARTVRYALFSAAGFDDKMKETAVRDDVVLVTGEDLLS